MTVYWYWYFGCDNSSSFHTDNQKNNILVLDEGPPGDIDGSLGAAEKHTINFIKENTRFYLSLHHNDDESYLYGNKTEIC